MRAVAAAEMGVRWGLSVIAIGGFVLAWAAGTPGMVGLGIAVGIVFALAAVLAFAQARIEASARAESLDQVQLSVLQAGLGDRNSPSPEHESSSS